MSNERQLAQVQFLTVAEVASIMRVSKMTVYRLVHAGDLRRSGGPLVPGPGGCGAHHLQGSFIDTA